MYTMNKDLEYKHKCALEHALDEHFPKYKCKERSQALMLYASAIMAHEEIMCQVRKHMNVLLGDTVTKTEYQEALDFYKAITQSRN